jgi:hypothetical protein
LLYAPKIKKFRKIQRVFNEFLRLTIETKNKAKKFREIQRVFSKSANKSKTRKRARGKYNEEARRRRRAQKKQKNKDPPSPPACGGVVVVFAIAQRKKQKRGEDAALRVPRYSSVNFALFQHNTNFALSQIVQTSHYSR